MKKKIDIFLNNKENITILANEIITIFVSTANKDNLDYEFDLAKGTGKLKNRKPNTFFVFDTKPHTTIDLFKKASFNEDLAEIQQNSIEEKELIKKIDNFLNKVSTHIMSNNKEQLQETIRRVILPKSTKENIPLNEILITSIDVADFSSIPESSKYLLKIHKHQNINVDTGGIIKFIQEKQEDTGKTVEEIYEEEKDNNPLLKNISAIKKGNKYLYDVTVVFFVDYSLSHLPPQPSVN